MFSLKVCVCVSVQVNFVCEQYSGSGMDFFCMAVMCQIKEQKENKEIRLKMNAFIFA